MHGAVRMRSTSASGTRRSPTFLLSLSTNTGRAGSKRRSASQTRESNCFCPGCALPGTRPEHRAAVIGERLQVEHLRALRAQRLQQPALARTGGAADHAVLEARRAKRRAPAALRAGTRGSRLRAGGRESRSGRAPARARRCACRRASSRPAASSPSACRAPRARCARRCCAPPARRRAFSPRTARPACTRCRRARARRRSATASSPRRAGGLRRTRSRSARR